ncbi:MAG: nitronate monooxygenase [Actinobacteria bacterium]|nr:MAG: nitronate monooxygenase [Actinomycetota bacterium]
MIRTAFTEMLGIEHPVVSAGMGAGMADGDLAGAVSHAGGLGVVGASWLRPEQVAEMVARAREITDRPIAVNLLLFGNEHLLDDVLRTRPAVLSTAWAADDQDLAAIFASAHEAGAKVMHMVPRLDDAERAVEAGADVVVAQGTDGGGHVGLVGTTVVVRQVVKAVSPIPVLAAGGLADGAGLAAALALGASGILLGTRFLATNEAPLDAYYKDAIVASDGTDTVVTTVGEALTGRDWPGAFARVARTRFVEEWLGREPELRRRRSEVWDRLEQADANADADYALMWFGQSAGLIDSVAPVADVVRQIVADAEQILRGVGDTVA